MTRGQKVSTACTSLLFGAVLFGVIALVVQALRGVLQRGLPALLVLLLLASPAAAQDRKTPIALGAYMTAGFWDASATAYCSGAKTCHEINPVLAPIVDRRGVVPAMAAKGALHVGIAAWLLHDRHQHPKRAFWTAIALTGAQLAVNIGNTRRLRGVK